MSGRGWTLPPSSFQRPPVTVTLLEEAEENSPPINNVFALFLCTQTTTTTATTCLSLYEQQQQQQPLLTTMQIDACGTNAAGVSGVVGVAANDHSADNDEEKEKEPQHLMVESGDGVPVERYVVLDASASSPAMTMTKHQAQRTTRPSPTARNDRQQRDGDGESPPTSVTVDSSLVFGATPPNGNLAMRLSNLGHRRCCDKEAYEDVRQIQFVSSLISSANRFNAFQAPSLPAARPKRFSSLPWSSRSALRAKSRLSTPFFERRLPLVYAICIMVAQFLSHLGASDGAVVPTGFAALASGGGSGGARTAPVRSTLSPASAIEGMNPIMRYRLRLQFQERLRLLNQTLNRKRPTAATTSTTTPSTYGHPSTSFSYSSNGGGNRSGATAFTTADRSSQALINNISSATQTATAPLSESDARAASVVPVALHEDGEQVRYESRNCFFSPIQCRLPVVEVQSANRHRQQQQQQANKERNGTHGRGGGESAETVYAADAANEGVQLVDSASGDSLNIVGTEDVIPADVDEYVGGGGDGTTGDSTSVVYADAASPPLEVPAKRRYDYRVPSRRQATANDRLIVVPATIDVVQRRGVSLQHQHHNHGLKPSRRDQQQQHQTYDVKDELLMYLVV